MKYFLFICENETFVVCAENKHQAFYWASEWTDDKKAELLKEITKQEAYDLPYKIF